MNLNRVVEPPITAGSNCRMVQIAKHLLKFQVEPTMLQPRLDSFKEEAIFFVEINE